MDLSVCVIGTIFIDFKGFAFNQYNPLGRNLGKVEFIHGGVGRNIAESLVNLGLPVTFVSTVDQSAIGTEVIERLSCGKVNTSFLWETENDGMGMWLALINENGELVGSISKMPDLTLLGKLISAKGNEIIKNSSHVVLELDLNLTITRNVISLSKKMQKPVYGIPGNLDVILRNKDIIPDLECFICNDIEAGQIIGINLAGLSIEQLIERLSNGLFRKEKSSRYMVVTLGSQGSIYYDSVNNIIGHQPVIPTVVVDTSGAGDSFFSGTVMGLINNVPLREAVVYGTKVASFTIGCNENVYQGVGEIHQVI